MIEVVMPKLGLTMTEGEIIEWRKREGDEIQKNEVLLVIETEKVTYEVEASGSGILGRILVKEHEVVPVGTIIAYILEAGENVNDIPELPLEKPKEEVLKAVPVEQTKAVQVEMPARIKISPLARRIAQEHKIDISKIKGSGPDGRIVKEDILQALEVDKITTAQPVQIEQRLAEEEKIQLSSMRRVIARRMTESFQTPHFYLTVEVDARELVKARDALTQQIESMVGVRITYTDLLIKMVATALEDNPSVNCAYIDGYVKVFKRIDIGFVTSVERGLVVPVIRQANTRSLPEIVQARAKLADKARQNKLSIEEMSNSTFTISNLGMFGIDQFNAILQPPEAAILAIGRIADRAVVRDGKIVVSPTMNLTLSIDHRVLDGVGGAQFLTSLKNYIENPMMILLR